MKRIKLTKGHFALVDDTDFERVSTYSWFTQILKQSNNKFRYYARAEVNGKKILMHRYIMNLNKSIKQVDHINGNSLDNRQCNLRICSSSENNCNANKTSKKTSSKYKGVCYEPFRKCYGKITVRKSKWKSSIQKNKKRIVIGYFKTEIEAAKAYNQIAKKLHGKFVKLNPGEE